MLALLLAITLAFGMPTLALAGTVDSLASGFETLVNPNTDVKVPDGLPNDYEPNVNAIELSAPAQNALPDDASTADYVNHTLDSFNKAGGFGSTLLNGVRNLLWNTSETGVMIVGGAAAMVFLWWGVRKGVRILFAALRKGRMTV